MRQKLKNVVNGIRNSVVLITHKVKDEPTGSKSVYFDLTKSAFVFSYFFIIFAYLVSGFKVYLRFNFKFISGFYGQQRTVISHPNLFLVRSFPKDPDLTIITDHVALSCKDNRFVYLNPDAFSVCFARYSIPYLMHPSQYASGRYLLVNELRSTNKVVKIFYSGNTIKSTYDNPIILSRFGILNRYQVIESIIQHLSADEVCLLNSKTDLDAVFSGDRFINKVVMSRWEWSPASSSNLGARVNESDWFKVLAGSQFFLACPGNRMPHSHNAVEAMSVGCIPILAYADYLEPPLTDGVNCICYSKENLIDKIREVLSMDNEKITKLSENVMDYYDRYLSLKRIPEIIQTARNGAREVFYVNETFETWHYG